jgi:Uma2 family endonuclease
MGMPAQHTEWTAEMARALPDDGNRYEVLDGELVVTPAPRLTHQRAVQRLLIVLTDHVERHRIGWVYHSPADIELSPRRLVQPDLFVVPWGDGRAPKEWSDITSLLLVVEVTSPSTARVDRQHKRRLFQDARVPEYWIVDVEARLVERWRPDDTRPEVLTDTLIWHPDLSVSPLAVDLRSLFATILEPPSARAPRPPR